MSTSTIRGTIENFSPKPDKDHYGILIDTTNEGEQWFNGDGSIPNEWEKNDKIKLKINKHEDKEIQKWYLPEKNVSSGGSGSQDSSGEAEDSDMDGQRKAEGAATTSHIRKNQSILAQKALEEARKLHQEEHDNSGFDSRGAYMEQLTSTADGFFNWMLDKAEVDKQ